MVSLLNLWSFYYLGETIGASVGALAVFNILLLCIILCYMGVRFVKLKKATKKSGYKEIMQGWFKMDIQC